MKHFIGIAMIVLSFSFLCSAGVAVECGIKTGLVVFCFVTGIVTAIGVGAWLLAS
jgi:hypothetical protein